MKKDDSIELADNKVEAWIEDDRIYIKACQKPNNFDPTDMSPESAIQLGTTIKSLAEKNESIVKEVGREITLFASNGKIFLFAGHGASNHAQEKVLLLNNESILIANYLIESGTYCNKIEAEYEKDT